MRKIVLAATVAGVALSLSGCDNKQPAASQTPSPEAAPTLSPTDKAAVDALGTDLLKLAEAIKSSSGSKREYADGKLVELLKTATDVDTVSAVFDILPPGSGYAKGEAISAKGRLKK